MWNSVRVMLLGLLSSKKAGMAVTAAVVWGVGRVGLNLSPQDVAGIVASLIAYVLGQSYVDAAKEKARAPTIEQFRAQVDAMAAGTIKADGMVSSKSLGGPKGGGDGPFQPKDPP